jgi:hypothetical protein
MKINKNKLHKLMKTSHRTKAIPELTNALLVMIRTIKQVMTMQLNAQAIEVGADENVVNKGN